MENGYRRAVQEAATNLSNISTDLVKGMYCGSPAQLSQVSAKLWKEASSAKSAISVLPVAELHLDKTNRFLSQVGDYAMVLSRKSANGQKLTAEERQWLMSRNSPGKPHLGRILMDRGLCTDLSSGIRKYVQNVPGRDRIEAETAVRAIEAAGGISVWAHPLGGEGEKRLTDEQFEAQLETLLGYGIRGMECWYSRYSMEEVRFLCSRAAEHGLIVTGGSDYHGMNKTGLDLGMLNTERLPADIDWQGLSDVLTDAVNMV
jgi:hypothetical protein